MFRRWVEGTLQSVLATVLLALLPGAALTYLARINSVWTIPVLFGLGAAALVSIIVVAATAIRRLPPRRIITHVDNIESSTRLWLDNFRVGVRNEPISETHFRLIATMDSGTVMAVSRPRGELSNYLFIRSDINPSADDMRVIAGLPDHEAKQILLEILLELARFHVGHSPVAVPVKPFNVFRRIPINESLTEHTLLGALEEVEAALHAVRATYALGLWRIRAHDIAGLASAAPKQSSQ